MTRHIVVIEDDSTVRSTIERWLSQDGFRVTALSSGTRLNEMLLREEIDLVLLDIGLPDIDGLTLARRIREQHTAAIIIVSGRGDSIDRIIGLEAGADDYIAKPFDPREILARIRCVLRRADNPPARAKRNTGPHRYSFDRWIVDLHAYTVEDSEGSALDLTTGEFTLLREFVLHANNVLSRDRLIALVGGRDSPAFDRSIDVRVGRLRRKLKDCSRQPRLIKTVRNVGYVFSTKPVAISA